MNKKAFTLIELMIVVAIIGILASIAIPKFSNLINKAKEGATKGELSTIRSALQIYYGDNEGWFPAGINAFDSLTINAKYITQVPVTRLPGTGHTDSNAVNYFSYAVAPGILTPGTQIGAADRGGWAYFSDKMQTTFWGSVVVNCSHKDLVGQANPALGSYWTSF